MHRLVEEVLNAAAHVTCWVYGVADGSHTTSELVHLSEHAPDKRRRSSFIIVLVDSIASSTAKQLILTDARDTLAKLATTCPSAPRSPRRPPRAAPSPAPLPPTYLLRCWAHFRLVAVPTPLSSDK